MHSPHSTIWQLSVYEWWISCADNSTMYSLDAFITQYHLASITYAGIIPGGVIWPKVQKSGKMGSWPGSPFGLEDKPPWTSWMFNFGGFTDSPHPNKRETRGLDTIQAASFFPLVATSLLSRRFWGKWSFVKTTEIRKNPEKSLEWYWMINNRESLITELHLIWTKKKIKIRGIKKTKMKNK